MFVVKRHHLRFALIATCLSAGAASVVAPETAFAQSAGDNGFGLPDGTPHVCAIENTGDRGFSGDTYDLACGTNARAGRGNGDDAANTAIGGSAVAMGIFNTEQVWQVNRRAD